VTGRRHDHATGPGTAGRWPDEHREILDRALAGIELDDEERRLVGWLAGWDCPTVAAVAALLRRARAA
jgi:hypothetical protein